MQLFNIGDEVEVISEEEMQGMTDFYPDKVKQFFGAVGTIGDVEFDDWNEQYVYRIDIDGAKQDIWFVESMLIIHIPKGEEEITLHAQMKILMEYVQAFFPVKELKGKKFGALQMIIITAYTPLYQVVFYEREQGEVRVVMKNRITEEFLETKKFIYVGEENVLVPAINTYLETAGVI